MRRLTGALQRDWYEGPLVAANGATQLLSHLLYGHVTAQTLHLLDEAD